MEERRRRHHTFASFIQVCTSCEYHTVAAFPVTSVIKHFRNASKVANPDNNLVLICNCQQEPAAVSAGRARPVGSGPVPTC